MVTLQSALQLRQQLRQRSELRHISATGAFQDRWSPLLQQSLWNLLGAAMVPGHCQRPCSSCCRVGFITGAGPLDGRWALEREGRYEDGGGQEVGGEQVGGLDRGGWVSCPWVVVVLGTMLEAEEERGAFD